MYSQTYNKKIVFIAACAAIFIFGITIITLGSTLPQLTTQYHLSEVDKGILASLLPFGILAGSLIFGPVVDKYSYKYLLVISILLAIAGFGIIVYANVFYHLGIAFFLIGIGGGMINGATSAMVSDFSEDFNENKGANLSILGVFFGLGSLGMPIFLNLLSTWLVYTQIIAGIGVFMFLPLIFILIIRYPAPKQSQSMSLKNIGLLLRDTVLLLFGIALFFQSGWESLVNNWITTFLIDSEGIPEKKALFFLTMYILFFTISRISLGILLRNISGKKVMYISVLTALIGSIILVMAGNDWMVILAIMLLGFGLAAGFPVMLGFLGDRFAAWSGTAFGIVLSIALIGNILINYLTGLIANSTGISIYPYILVFVGASTVLFVVISLRRLV